MNTIYKMSTGQHKIFTYIQYLEIADGRKFHVILYNFNINLTYKTLYDTQEFIINVKAIRNW